MVVLRQRPLIRRTGELLNHTGIPSDPLRKPLALLHTSDLHIGSDTYPEKAIQAFNAVLDAAHETPVDAVLIAGDLFDAFRVPWNDVDYVIRSLAALACPVVILPGNHDTILTSPASSFPFRGLPANIHLLQAPNGEMVTLPSLGLSVWGKPVYNHEPSFRPLGGLPPRPSSGWYVAIAHGLVVNDNANLQRSSPIDTQELALADCDYIALGHVHRFENVTQVHPPAFYSGSPSDPEKPTVARVYLHPEKGVAVEAIHLPNHASGNNRTR
ncbi:MAG: DNA repair exonuclease [Dehalococcoidia bacterium]|nr:DNA repair exonuclease [Dehalococcoidia bacterium]